MFLSHFTIETYIRENKIIIGPEFDIKNIRPAGIRLHLGSTILIPDTDQIVDLQNSDDLKYQEIDLTKQKFYLEPNQFILASSYETIKTTADILAFLDGRSTIARLGLTTHITASVIDGLYEKPQRITLEVKNVGNFKIRLREKDPIALLLFAQLTEPVTQKLQTQYQAEYGSGAKPNLSFKTGFD